MTAPRILIVDDEPAVRAVVVALVRHCGYDPVPAGGGAEALAAYRRHSSGIAGAVLDVRMPDPDGPATLDLLRAAGAAFPVLFLTGSAGDYAAGALLARGAVAVLHKPITAGELGAALAAALAPAGGDGLSDTATAHGPGSRARPIA